MLWMLILSMSSETHSLKLTSNEEENLRIVSHTYIIGHYNRSDRIIVLVSNTTYVNFIHQWRDLQFKVNSERQMFCETFQIFLETCWKEIAEEIFFEVAGSVLAY